MSKSLQAMLSVLALVTLLIFAPSLRPVPQLSAQSRFVGATQVSLYDYLGSGIGPAVNGSLPIFCSNCSTGITNWGGGTLAKGFTAAAMTATTSTSVIAAVTSNYLYISSCRVSNTSTTVPTLVVLQDGSGGTTIDTIPAPINTSGAIVTYPVPLKVTTLGNALFAADVTTNASVIVSCNGFSSSTSY